MQTQFCLLRRGSLTTSLFGIQLVAWQPPAALSNIAVSLDVYTRSLWSNKPCIPIQPTVGEKTFATAAAASFKLLRENNGIDSYIETIGEITGFNRNPPYVFLDGRNGPEDTLGLISALVVSKIPLEGEVIRISQTSVLLLGLILLSSLFVILCLTFLSPYKVWKYRGKNRNGDS